MVSESLWHLPSPSWCPDIPVSCLAKARASHHHLPQHLCKDPRGFEKCCSISALAITPLCLSALLHSPHHDPTASPSCALQSDHLWVLPGQHDPGTWSGCSRVPE